jgi:RNA polymerase sigma-70 factor (ECF subfamily)
MVLGAQNGSPEQAHEALARLCQTYWYPVYAFLRHRGHKPHDAQDLTQGFFEHVLSHDFFKSVDPRKGRFRTFLLSSLNHFVINGLYRSSTRKRGGEFIVVSWDQLNETDNFDGGPLQEAAPDMVFDRTWALSLVQRVLEKVRAEYIRLGKAEYFEVLRAFLPRGTAPGSYEDAAAKLGMARSAFDLALHRFKKTFGKVLREAVAHTVDAAEDVAEEIRYLVSAWASAC